MEPRRLLSTVRVSLSTTLPVKSAGFFSSAHKQPTRPKPCKEGLWAQPKTDAVCGFGPRILLPKASQSRFWLKPNRDAVTAFGLYFPKGNFRSIRSRVFSPNRHKTDFGFSQAGCSCRFWAVFPAREMSAAGITATDGRRFRAVRTESDRRAWGVSPGSPGRPRPPHPLSFPSFPAAKGGSGTVVDSTGAGSASDRLRRGEDRTRDDRSGGCNQRQTMAVVSGGTR